MSLIRSDFMCCLSIVFSCLLIVPSTFFFFFFFNDTATTEIYTLSLHDALPIWSGDGRDGRGRGVDQEIVARAPGAKLAGAVRSEEHTSELQSRLHLVCRLLLEKKKKEKKV